MKKYSNRSDDVNLRPFPYFCHILAESARQNQNWGTSDYPIYFKFLGIVCKLRAFENKNLLIF